MEKIILIKYGELGTKKGNIKFFIDKLYQNIFLKLKDDNVNIKRNIARMYIELKDDNENIVIEKLKQVFGISGIVVAYKVPNNIEGIKKNILELLKKQDFTTFKIKTKRSNKQFPYPSMELSSLVGAYILNNINKVTVDVHNPDLLLTIEVRTENAYIYTNEIKGLGGYPVGIQGKGILMLSGGIDSPVAGFLSLKRGVDIECLYFESPPHTSIEAQNKVIALTKQLANYTANIKLHIVPFTEIQEMIYKQVDPAYMITIMRRMMYRIGEQMVNQRKAHILINGESIGQVASQTLTSIRVINSVTNIPVIRPVACLDKLEIIELAKKIDTYDISILPYEDCCTIFIPKHPVINPDLEKCIDLEKKFNYQNLINECISNIKTIYINNLDKEVSKDLL